ncbi:OsmC family protein [Ornithinimicrobium sp. F0845]|uniref:OsmC family protein n=1 Tax=Ornithinimicrobium sp. F0845 TaxID=2926412 RepID=UPI001FF20300|nr:OsmC family protein [Ornithinimicrobium sp. F0845]MCK0112619.1 OsmC family protein [Ornithinimicrobium sp. F0845]
MTEVVTAVGADSTEGGADAPAAAAAALRARQKPVKTRYREDPDSALTPSTATARVDQAGLTATVGTWAGDVVAGLHPAAGGDGTQACSGDILLQALVACAGVTLSSVATALGVELRSATVTANGTWDARGTLGVDREAPVGLTGIELLFALDTDADEDKVTRLLELTERYCVVAQTLHDPPELSIRRAVVHRAHGVAVSDLRNSVATTLRRD